jgi:hypothetical protein
VLERLAEDVAALLLTEVHYKTGAVHDMAEVTRRAHEAGARRAGVKLGSWGSNFNTGGVTLSAAYITKSRCRKLPDDNADIVGCAR